MAQLSQSSPTCAPGTQLMDDSALEEDLSVAVAAVMDVWGPGDVFRCLVSFLWIPQSKEKV